MTTQQYEDLTSVQVLAASQSQQGPPIVTLKLVFPRFILAELNTHRVLSRNSASSRAIPTLDTGDPFNPKPGLVTRVRQQPFVPQTFNKRVKGMGVGDAFDEEEVLRALDYWIGLVSHATQGAHALASMELDKSRANRPLEPYMWHTAIVTATEWSNFLALRDHPDAQPEFQLLASKIRDALGSCVYRAIDWCDTSPYGYHLPMISDEEIEQFSKGHGSVEMLSHVAAGRLARVSYDTHENFEPMSASIKRAMVLRTNGHMSPFEHVARPFTDSEWLTIANMRTRLENAPNVDQVFKDKLSDQLEFIGNFRGWMQMRKLIPGEQDFAKIRNAVE